MDQLAETGLLQCTECGSADPKLTTLSCFHVLCAKCASELPAKCPVCREGSSPAIDSLASRIANCVSRVSEVSANKVYGTGKGCCICSLRGISNPVSHVCIDCGDALCITCNVGHTSSSLTHAHKVVDVDDVKAGNYEIQSQRKRPCNDVNHVSMHCELFCETCSKEICPICLKCCHGEHEVSSLEAAAEKRRTELNSLAEKLKKRIKGPISLLMNGFYHQQNQAKETREATVAVIQREVEKHIEAVLAQQRLSVKEVQAKCDQHLRVVKNEELKLKDLVNAAPVLLSVLHTAQQADNVDVLTLYSDITRCVNFTHDIQDAAVSFASNRKTPVFELTSMFASDAPMMKVTEDLLDTGFTATLVDVLEKADELVSSSGQAQHTPQQSSTSQEVAQPTVHADAEVEDPAHIADQTRICLQNIKEDIGNKEDDQLVLPESHIGVDPSVMLTTSLTITGTQYKECSYDHTKDNNFIDDKSGEGLALFTDIPTADHDLVQIPKQDEEDIVVTSLPKPADNTKTKLDKLYIGNASKGDLHEMLTVKKSHDFGVRVSKDVEDPKIIGMCIARKSKIVFIDESNKQVRLIDFRGTANSKNRPNTLTDSLSPNGVACCDNVVVYVCGQIVYTTDASLKLNQKFKIKCSPDVNASPVPLSLVICSHTNDTFLMANLPGNMYRIYKTDGTITKKKTSPVNGPIVAVSKASDGNFLFSSWSQTGAVYKVGIGGDILQIIRPPNVTTWYPDSTCQNSKHIIYVACSQEHHIYVFGPSGDLLLVHSTLQDDLQSPRCLVITQDDVIFASGDSPRIFKYAVEKQSDTARNNIIALQ